MVVEATLTHHHELPGDFLNSSYEWVCDKTIPFNELIISWKAIRPKETSAFNIFAKAFIAGEWSEWVHSSSWAGDRQHGGFSSDPLGKISSFQDIIQVQNGLKATGFKIKVETEGKACLSTFHALYASISVPKLIKQNPAKLDLSSVNIEVPAISQMSLAHPQCNHMCSASSTTAVLLTLLNKPKSSINPIDLAISAYDKTHNIFGNWTTMTAHASHILGHEWNVWVARLNGFEEIHHQLLKGLPVVVSVKGPLKGSALPYENGHLIVVKGYDATTKNVLCMDPAFKEELALKTYSIDDFLMAWGRRGHIAYMFDRAKIIHPL